MNIGNLKAMDAQIVGHLQDILTRKSGAVQNSPPDKHLPEPSPWSPVFLSFLSLLWMLCDLIYLMMYGNIRDNSNVEV